MADDLLTDEERAFLQELYSISGDEYLPHILRNITDEVRNALIGIDNEFRQIGARSLVSMAMEEKEKHDTEGLPDFHIGVVLGVSVVRKFFRETLESEYPEDVDWDAYADDVKEMLRQSPVTVQ